MGMLTGALNAYIDVTDNFGTDLVLEDNILYQINQYQSLENQHLKQEKGGATLFAGDDVWMMYQNYFNRTYPQAALEVAELDKQDVYTRSKLLPEIEKGDFRMIIGHLLGLDHAGHCFGMREGQVERKLKDTENLFKEIIERMDNETVLVAVGDHGMTDIGNHGGSDVLEISTVFAAYTKRGFPMKKKTA